MFPRDNKPFYPGIFCFNFQRTLHEGPNHINCTYTEWDHAVQIPQMTPVKSLVQETSQSE